MSDVVIDRNKAIDVLTTHRHGENQETCTFCASYFGDLIDKLHEAGVVKNLHTEEHRRILAWLVELHDGPRDRVYEEAKPRAWAAARKLVRTTSLPKETET